MNQLLNIIYSVVGIVLSGVATWLVTYLTKLLNQKIKDKTAARLASELTTLVINSVQCVYQTYVESLKKDGKFDADAQNQALEKALKYIKNNASQEIMDWLSENRSDIDSYLKTLVESSIYRLK